MEHDFFGGDLGHSETGSGETVGRVLTKKKKKKVKEARVWERVVLRDILN